MSVNRFTNQVQGLFGIHTTANGAATGQEESWSIAFVCTGNICRSPYAELTLGALVRESPLAGCVAAFSAGVHAVIGHDMDTCSAAIYAKNFGTDPPPHPARQLTEELVTQSDLLLVMEAEQRRTVLGRYPQAFPRTFLLTEYVIICRTLVNSGSVSQGRSGSTPATRLRALTADAARHRSLGAGAADIADPYHRSKEFHEKVAGQIRRQLDELMSILVVAAGLAG